jgi:hypothetical protein
MPLIIVYFVIIQCVAFFFLAIGAFILSHLGLLLVGRIDAYLSPENRQRVTSSSISGSSGGSVGRDNFLQPRNASEVNRNIALRMK